eukprot:scaffold1775_cov83-Cylindrotheca_fusiformis.AAC.8
MFNLFSATRPVGASTKAAQLTNEEPTKASEPASEQRDGTDGAEGAPELAREPADETRATVFDNVESVVCANDHVKGALDYALSSGHEGDIIDQLFSNAESLTCGDESSVEDVLKFEVAKENKEETIGLTLRNSQTTKGIYVHRLAPGSKIEATGIEIGQKVLRINGKPCPSALSGAIGLLRDAPSQVVLEVTTNDEAVKQIKELGLTGKDGTLNADLTEIAVDGDRGGTSPGFAWSLQNGIRVFSSETNKPVEESAVEDERRKEAAKAKTKNKLAKKKKGGFFKGLKRSNNSKKLFKKKNVVVVEALPKDETKAQTKEAKTEVASDKEVASDEEAAPDKEVPEEEAPKEEVPKKVAEIPKDSIYVKVRKEDAKEPVGLALRNSTVTDGVYVFGVLSGGKLEGTAIVEKMRIYTINGEPFSSAEDAVAAIKRDVQLEICAGPNDEHPHEEEDFKDFALKSMWWLW